MEYKKFCVNEWDVNMDNIFFLLLPSYFLYLNLHVYWVILFYLIDVLMKPSITYCIFTSTFVLSISGTFHLLFVVKTLASSYSFVTLMKSLLLD